MPDVHPGRRNGDGTDDDGVHRAIDRIVCVGVAGGIGGGDEGGAILRADHGAGVKPPVLTLLFDLDGTMTDTDALHLAAYNALLAPLGRSMTLAYYRSHVMGFPNDVIMPGLFPNEHHDQHIGFAAAKEAAFRASIDRLEPLAGLLDVLDWADAMGCARVVVTNAPRDNAMLMLGGLGLQARFPVMVIGEELAHGKPHPLPYLTGLQRTNGTAEHALAFEDSLSGVQAAAGAGIHTVGMLTSLPETALCDAGASSVAADFRDPVLWALLRSRLQAARGK
jgi:HAD superfamily hydrolase (TIGR01509 family)